MHHRCLTDLYTGLQKQCNFLSEAKVEQIIAIAIAHIISY